MTPAKFRDGDPIRYRFGMTEGEGRIVTSTPAHVVIDTEGRGEQRVPHANLVGLADSQKDPRIAARAKLEAEAAQAAAARRAIQMRKAADAWAKERSLAFEPADDSPAAHKAEVERLKRWLHGAGAHELQMMRKAEQPTARPAAPLDDGRLAVWRPENGTMFRQKTT